MLAVMAVVALLSGVFAYGRLGERGRVARCSRNLAVLGQAMQSFAQDHKGGLPPAGMESPETTWDIDLVPYLGAAVWPVKIAFRQPAAHQDRGLRFLLSL